MLLQQYPFNSVTLVAMGLYLVAVALAFPIQCTPAIQILLEVIKNRYQDETPSEKTLKIFECIARPVFVLMACEF